MKFKKSATIDILLQIILQTRNDGCVQCARNMTKVNFDPKGDLTLWEYPFRIFEQGLCSIGSRPKSAEIERQKRIIGSLRIRTLPVTYVKVVLTHIILLH